MATGSGKSIGFELKYIRLFLFMARSIISSSTFPYKNQGNYVLPALEQIP